MGIRAEQAKFTNKIMERLEKCLVEEFGDIFHTGENFNTLTFECGEFDGAERYGSVKFTLHKKDYDLDESIEVFEDFFEMREKKERDAEAKKARAAKKEEVCSNE